MFRFKVLIPVIAVVLLLPGCSTSTFYINPVENNYERNLTRLNYLGGIYSSDIILDSAIAEASELKITGDSIRFTDTKGNVVFLPVSRVTKIEMRDNVNQVFNTVWFPIITVAGTGIITAVSGNIAPALVGVMLTPVAAVYAFFFTGYKEFIFIHNPEKDKAEMILPCNKNKY